MKPVKELTLPRNNRQLVWTALRASRESWVTLAALSEQADVKSRTVYMYLQALIAAGYVAVETAADRCKLYRLTKDAGVDAPRLRPDGTEATPKNTEIIWRTIKIMHTFTLDSLTAHVRMTHEVQREWVKKYIISLLAAGYLGKRSREDYVLLHNTGSQAPQLLNIREVYDPNLNQIMLREVPDYE
ncbi:hypothetical protein [Neisseria sp. 74A18]|uniref:hypothetical protein n=1 Tax=Neisseria sp. 74A18 TaxID=1696094 RepID=UPI0006CAF61A|nr:hypothetical protein [Neisseria sp. 74A18]KPN73694.1 hypothetical protein AKG43_06815 [Neisseria sp. 74A18]